MSLKLASLEFNIDFGKLLKEILELDENIRFVMLFNKKGKILQVVRNKETVGYLTKKERIKSIKQIVHFLKSNKAIVKKFGNFQYSLSSYEKVKRIFFVISENNFLYITIEPQTNATKLIEAVLSEIAKIPKTYLKSVKK